MLCAQRGRVRSEWTEHSTNGADIRFIRAILGHAQLTTTEINPDVSIAKLKEVHALSHPAERRMP